MVVGGGRACANTFPKALRSGGWIPSAKASFRVWELEPSSLASELSCHSSTTGCFPSDVLFPGALWPAPTGEFNGRI